MGGFGRRLCRVLVAQLRHHVPVRYRLGQAAAIANMTVVVEEVRLPSAPSQTGRPLLLSFERLSTGMPISMRPNLKVLLLPFLLLPVSDAVSPRSGH